jgi:isocitrate lyase
MGIVWQFQPVWAGQGLTQHYGKFAEEFSKDGMSYYMREVAAPAIVSIAKDKNGVLVGREGNLSDSFFDIAAGRNITHQDG